MEAPIDDRCVDGIDEDGHMIRSCELEIITHNTFHFSDAGDFNLRVIVKFKTWSRNPET